MSVLRERESERAKAIERGKERESERAIFSNTLFILDTQKIVVPSNINEKLQLKKLKGTAH